MSIILRKIIILACLSNFCIIFSQEIKKQKLTTVFIELENCIVANYTINKANTSAEFSFYLKGYETKQARDLGVKKYKKGLATSLGKPTFIFTLYSSTVFSPKPQKAEKLKNIEGIEYITLKEFQSNNYQCTSSVYIIHKLKDGTYLKWKTYYLNEE